MGGPGEHAGTASRFIPTTTPLPPTLTLTPQPVYSSAQSPEVHTATFAALDIQKKTSDLPASCSCFVYCSPFSIPLGAGRVFWRGEGKSEDHWKLVTGSFILSKHTTSELLKWRAGVWGAGIQGWKAAYGPLLRDRCSLAASTAGREDS